MFQLSKSLSTRTGFNPFFITQRTVEIIENEGTIISSPSLKFKDLIAISKAAVPFDTATPNFFYYI